ncbi:IS1595 family transposase [Massilia oculi]|uniref:IS1595 family transposase n=1 Tax=Massilia oculi TaxID=945844 RepID=A0A2S2DNY1_9BURK|nr:IS1595 family transposase [Massilia oculi]AWL07085.1 IS1595 family transposase [Massilia oculi]
MKAPNLTKLCDRLSQLNQPQRQQVLAALHPAAGLDRVVVLIGEIRSMGRCCPDCGCERCHRHGQANDLQRYRCRACGRTFNDLTGTPLARLRHKGKWLDYLEAVLDSRTVRSAAKRVGVHPNTTFRWRHRFLDRVKDDRPERLVGIVEADETFLLESQKGSRKLDRQPRKRGGSAALRGISHHLDCILVARDRRGQTIDAVTGRGPLKVTQLIKHLLPKLDSQALLVTDANAAYRAFAQAHGIAHQAVNLGAGKRVRSGAEGAIHVQNVNAYHRRFKEWLLRFHGVASRWLSNYLGWQWALDGGRVSSVEQLLRIVFGVINR